MHAAIRSRHRFWGREMVDFWPEGSWHATYARRWCASTYVVCMCDCGSTAPRFLLLDVSIRRQINPHDFCLICKSDWIPSHRGLEKKCFGATKRGGERKKNTIWTSQPCHSRGGRGTGTRRKLRLSPSPLSSSSSSQLSEKWQTLFPPPLSLPFPLDIN